MRDINNKWSRVQNVNIVWKIREDNPTVLFV
jgi:hypothetical protein